MTMKLKGLQKYNEQKAIFADLVTKKAPQDEQDEAYMNMMNAMAEDLLAESRKESRNEAEKLFDATRGNPTMTAEVTKFFNDINTEVGYKEEKLLPQTVIDEIFEDLTTEHPFLASIGMKTTGLRLKFLKSETSGVAVWGKIFGEIKGQLDAAFSDEEAIQNKLTAFVVLPKDLNDFGPAWIKRYVVTQITEAFSVALEIGFITGDGKEQPIGLTREVKKDVAIVDGKHPEKKATGTLTFSDPKSTVKELVEVFKYHSIKENKKAFNSAGKVTLLVNPVDAWDVRTQYTHLNANGVYVTAMPFNLTILESVFVPAKKAISYVAERYDAYVAGGVNIQKYDQTLALEDLDLYTAKQFAYGKAKDDKVAAIWDLKIETEIEKP